MHVKTNVRGLSASLHVTLFLLLTVQPSRGDEQSADARKELLHVGRLADRLDRALADRTPAQVDPALDDARWLERVREDDEMLKTDVLSGEMLRIAKQYAGTAEALSSLVYLIRHGSSTVDPETETWQAAQAAIDLAEQHYLHHVDLPVITSLATRMTTDKAEDFLRRVVKESSHTTCRVAAKLHLVEFLVNKQRRWEITRRIKEKKSQLSDFERVWTLLLMPLLERQGEPNNDALVKEIDTLLTMLTNEGNGIPLNDYEYYGPGTVFWRVVAGRQEITITEKANRLKYQLLNIAPGKPAPPIEGSDAFGTRFALSDFRGKVVLLSFTANWCGGCVKSHPIHRSLIQHFEGKPFVILGVSRDERVETLQKSIETGDITWRCWWDGLEGPIAARWNVEGIPRYFLIDHSGTLHSILSASEHDLVEAVTPVAEQAIQALTRQTDDKSD